MADAAQSETQDQAPGAAGGKHLYLVDGSGYIFRAYHKLPPLTDPEGTPVGAVYGFTTMLMKLQQDLTDQEHPTHLAVIFDAAKYSFRNEIYAAYKANRPDPPEDLIPQFPLTRDAVRALSIPSIEMEGYEADDIIASYVCAARDAGWKVTIVSSDKDLMQLLDDTQVDMYDTMAGRHLGVAAVKDKFGVGPDKVIEVQALMGDSIDNVPGVPGIGPKIAAELINQYGDLESVLANADEIKQPKRRQNLIDHAEQARISKRLVTLDCEVPLPVPLDDMAISMPATEPLAAFLDAHGFKSLKAKLIAADPDAVADQSAAEIAVEETDYECVTTRERLEAWAAAIRKARAVAIDTETTGLNAMQAGLCGISLSIEAGKACYIPVGHGAAESGELALEAGDKPEQLELETVRDVLGPLLSDRSILKIGQNIKYDMLILKRHGFALAPVADTMLISYVLESGQGGHGMDELARRHLGHECISFTDVVGKGKGQITFDKVPLDKATDYAAEDADVTGRLHRLLSPRLRLEGLLTVYETLERPLVPVLVAMEHEGVKVDRAMLSRLSGEFAQRMGGLEAEIHELAGRKFNLGSPKQLGEILFDEMGLPPPKKTKTGAYQTGADTLEKLAAEGHALPRLLLDWRQLQKLKSTYTDTLQNQIHAETGRVHTSYQMASTSTGRLSSNDPNLQNIPIRTEEGRRIRQAFVPEDGYKLLAADYSQIELRLLAHIADIEALKDAFKAGQDIHAMTASEVFGVPIKGMDPMVRRRAKAINFGIIYGISPFGLARQLDIAQSEAKGYIDTYFERFPGIRRYMEETKEQARARGYVETIYGRRAHMAGIKDKNPARRGFFERAAINAPIQGSAADIMRRAMIRIPPALEKAGLADVRMLLQVHDELVFEVPEDNIDKASELIGEVMSRAAEPAAKLSVPLVVDTGVGGNWDEAH